MPPTFQALFLRAGDLAVMVRGEVPPLKKPVFQQRTWAGNE